MARESIITSGGGDDDDRNRFPDEEERALRPQRIRDMVGQGEVTARLDIALDAARKRSEILGHILFDGPPGLGKTTFATVLPNELGTSIQTTSGPAAVSHSVRALKPRALASAPNSARKGWSSKATP